MNHPPNNPESRTPNFVRVVFDPSRFGEMLMKFLVGLRDGPAGSAVKDRPGPGGPLINGENQMGAYDFKASANALPNASAASGPEPVMSKPSCSTGLPV